MRTERWHRLLFNRNLYVPPDEQFSQKKLTEVTSNVVRAAMHFVMPETRSIVNNKSRNFESFDQIHRLFTGDRGLLVDKKLVTLLKHKLPDDLFKKVKLAMDKKPVEFPLPRIATGNEGELDGRTDESFSHLFCLIRATESHLHFGC